MLQRLALSATVAAGLLGSPQDPATPSGTGSVVVTVLEAGTRRPVAGARVVADPHRAMTGADGRARIEGLQARTSWVHVFSDEHLSSVARTGLTPGGLLIAPPDIPQRLWAARNPDYPGILPVTIRAGATAVVEFVLPRGAVVAGYVHSPDGQPLAGARVDVLAVHEESTDIRVFGAAKTATTDRRGAFRATGIGTGDYYVRISREPERRRPGRL